MQCGTKSRSRFEVFEVEIFATNLLVWIQTLFSSLQVSVGAITQRTEKQRSTELIDRMLFITSACTAAQEEQQQQHNSRGSGAAEN